jgi:SNF2 family DNA or RNA helicase
MPPTLTRKDDRLVLDLSTTTGRSDFNDALNKVREIPGKQFDWDTKLWSFPDEPMVADRILRTIQPLAEEELLEWIRQSRTRAADEVTTPLPDDAKVLVPWGNQRMPWQPKKINDEPFNGLFDYQRSAVAHMARVQRAILADDMGLGKTIQAISTVEEFRLRNPNQDGTLIDGPKLIVAPKSVKGGWQRELGRFLEPGSYGVQVIDGSNPATRHDQLQRAIVDDLWTIINWEMLRIDQQIIKVKHRGGSTSKKKVAVMKEPLFQVPWAAHMGLGLDDLDYRAVERLRKMEDKIKGVKEKVTSGTWLAILADEIHRAKNRKAKQTKGLHRTSAALMLGLTGTPVMNSPDELWSLLHWLWPHEYTSHDRFFNHYVDYYEENYGNRKGIVITGVKNPDALRFELRGRIVRRTTGSVRVMPGHRRVYIDVDLLPAQRKAYKDAEKEMWLAIEKDIDAGDPNAGKLAAALTKGDIAAIHTSPTAARAPCASGRSSRTSRSSAGRTCRPTWTSSRTASRARARSRGSSSRPSRSRPTSWPTASARSSTRR